MKREKLYTAVLTILVAVFFSMLLLPTMPSSSAAQNQTVLTKVNVTNTNPNVFNVTVTPESVALNPGDLTNITCNATVEDFNGVPVDISNVSAHLYLSSLAPTSQIKNDTHYFTFCHNATYITSNIALYSCDFSVYYFARNGTWICNVTATDYGYVNGSDGNTTVIQPLVALNVTDVLNYGNIPASNISDAQEANISNFGNVALNISVRGWGGQDESLYANLSMVCDLGNISVDLQRYNITKGVSWSTNMTNLTGIDQQIKGLRVNARNDTHLMMNQTYWRLKVPNGVAGQCNGTILFTASGA